MSQPTAASDQTTCTHHEDAPAIARCTECDAAICGACHGADRRGFALCPPCRGEPFEALPAWERPTEDYTPGSFGRTLWRTIRHPRSFFEGMSADGAWMPAAFFGVIAMTLGLLVDRLWKFTLQPELAETLTQFSSAQQVDPELLRIMVFVTTPVTALIAAAVHVALLKTAIGIADGEPIGWRPALRIAGYALGSYAFLAVPPVGGLEVGRFLTIVWLFNLEATALQRFWGFDPWKATLTVIIPAFGIFICGG